MIRARNKSVHLSLELAAGRTLSAKRGEGKSVTRIVWSETILMAGKEKDEAEAAELRRSAAEAEDELREQRATEGLEHLQLIEDVTADSGSDPFGRLIKGYKEMFNRTPTNVEAHFQYGRQFLQVSLNNWAVIAFRRALKLAPQWADAHYYYASALFAAGRIDEAAAEYEKGLKLDPTMMEARFEKELLKIRQEKVKSESLQ